MNARFNLVHGGRSVVNGWNTCICPVTYDLISAKVPQVVVRLERGIAQISVPSDLLFIVAAGRIPFHRRGVGCQHRGGVPRRTSGAEQVAAPGKVVAGHPPLCGAHHIMGRSICSPHHRLVCYPLHGALSCPTVCICSRRRTVEFTCHRIRSLDGYGPVPALPFGGVDGQARTHRRI